MTDFSNLTLTLSDLGISTDNIVIPDYEEMERIEREDIRSAREDERVKMCGLWTQRLNPSTGGKFWYQISCGYHRRCIRCLERRAGEFSDRASRCEAETESLAVILMNKGEAKKFIRKLDTPYWRVPIEEGLLVFFDAGGIPIGDKEEVLISDLNWMELCISPRGSQHSGKLGSITKTPAEGIVVNCPQLIVELDGQSMLDAWDATMEITDDLHPSYDEDEISYCCWQRMTVFKEECVGRGGIVINEVIVRLRVEESSYTEWRDIGTILPEEIKMASLVASQIPFTEGFPNFIG